MMTPPLSIWARPFLVVQVDVSGLMARLIPQDPVRVTDGWPAAGSCPFGSARPHAPAGLSHGNLAAPSSATVKVAFELGCEHSSANGGCCGAEPRTARGPCRDP